MKELQKSITIVNAVITPETVQEIIRKASAINWGTHLLRWRYFDVIHEGKPIHRGALIPTALGACSSGCAWNRNGPLGQILSASMQRLAP